MVRPLNRKQQLQNAAFLRALRKTGSSREATRALGVTRATFFKRRAKHPAFAQQWDAALAFAHARLSEAGGKARLRDPAAAEPHVCRLKSGRLQLRRQRASALDRAGEQRFLAALSATANVSLSCMAAGYDTKTLYQRKSDKPAFAREWRLALEMGYERVEMALLASSLPESFEDDHWRHNEPPAIPPMTANQALQLLHLHQKEARLWTTPVPDRLRPGETWQARSVQMGMIYEARMERDRERFRIAEAERLARGEETYQQWGPGELPDLSQVTGWSKADAGKAAHHEDVALFGGWRLGDLKRQLGGG